MSFLQLLVVRRKMMKLKESDIGVGFLKIQWSDCRGKKKKVVLNEMEVAYVDIFSEIEVNNKNSYFIPLSKKGI